MDNSTSTLPGSNKHAVFLPSLTNLLHHRGNFLLTAIFVIVSHSLTPRPRMTTRSIPNHSPVWSNASPESNLQRHLAVKLHNTPKLSTNSWYLPQISRQLKPPNCFNFCFVYSIFLLVVRHRFYPDRVPYKNSEFSILLRRRDQHFSPKWSNRNWSQGNDIFWYNSESPHSLSGITFFAPLSEVLCIDVPLSLLFSPTLVFLEGFRPSRPFPPSALTTASPSERLSPP